MEGGLKMRRSKFRKLCIFFFIFIVVAGGYYLYQTKLKTLYDTYSRLLLEQEEYDRHHKIDQVLAKHGRGRRPQVKGRHEVVNGVEFFIDEQNNNNPPDVVKEPQHEPEVDKPRKDGVQSGIKYVDQQDEEQSDIRNKYKAEHLPNVPVAGVGLSVDDSGANIPDDHPGAFKDSGHQHHHHHHGQDKVEHDHQHHHGQDETQGHHLEHKDGHQQHHGQDEAQHGNPPEHRIQQLEEHGDRKMEKESVGGFEFVVEHNGQDADQAKQGNMVHHGNGQGAGDIKPETKTADIPTDPTQGTEAEEPEALKKIHQLMRNYKNKIKVNVNDSYVKDKAVAPDTGIGPDSVLKDKVPQDTGNANVAGNPEDQKLGHIQRLVEAAVKGDRNAEVLNEPFIQQHAHQAVAGQGEVRIGGKVYNGQLDDRTIMDLVLSGKVQGDEAKELMKHYSLNKPNPSPIIPKLVQPAVPEVVAGGGNVMGGNAGNVMGGNAVNVLGGNAGNVVGGNAGNVMGGNAVNVLGGNAGNIVGGNAGNAMGGNVIGGNAGAVGGGNALEKTGIAFEEFDLHQTSDETIQCVKLNLLNNVTTICVNNPMLDKPISDSLVKKGIWEGQNLKEFQKALEACPDCGVIDLGANLGVYSLTAAANQRKVLAVEPLLQSIGPFHRSITVNGFADNVTLLRNAMSNEHGYVEIKYPKPHGNLGAAYAVPITYREAMKRMTNIHVQVVQTITLNDLESILKFKKAILKVDIQGSEHLMFKAADLFLAAVDVPYIFMHWFHDENKKEALETADFLISSGYKPKITLEGVWIELEALTRDQGLIIWVKQH